MATVEIRNDFSDMPPHTFMVVRDDAGNVVAGVGFKPLNELSLLGPGKVDDDSQHAFNITSGEIAISQAQFTALLDYIDRTSANPPSYDIPSGMQCTTWLLQGLAEAGVIANGPTGVIVADSLLFNPYTINLALALMKIQADAQASTGEPTKLSLTDNASSVLDAISGLTTAQIEAAGNSLKELGEELSNTLESVKDSFDARVYDAQRAYQDTISSVSEGLGVLVNKYEQAVDFTADRIGDAEKFYQDAIGWVADRFEDVATLYGETQQAAADIANRLVAEGERAAASGLDVLKDFLGGALDSLDKAFGGDDSSGGFPIEDNIGLVEGFIGPFHNSQSVISPIVLDLDGDGIETTALGRGAYFDHSANGFAESTGWVGSDDGLLVRDLNGDGRISSGRELLGSETLLNDGQKAVNGFAALAELDQNADGKIDATDAAFVDLQVWRDLNEDGFSNAGELISLADAGIASINVGYTNSNYADLNGNEHRQVSSFTRTDSTSGTTADVWFKADETHSVAEEWLPVSDEIAALPDVRGLGNVYNLQQAMLRDSSGQLQSLVQTFLAETSTIDRNNTLQDLLFKWAGVDGIAPDARGPNIDARKVAVLERFVGDTWQSDWEEPGSNGIIWDNGALALAPAYDKLFELVNAQLSAQTYSKALFQLINYQWDAQTNGLIGELSAVKARLESEVAADQESGLLDAAEFIRAVKGLGSEQMLGLSLLQSNPIFNIDAYIRGTGASESIEGGVLDDLLVAGAGADTVNAGEGNDIVFGDAGDDTINADAGNDTLYGGAGDDTLNAGVGDDVVYGGAGDDSISSGFGGADLIYGEDGDDSISVWYGGLGTISGGQGNDTVTTYFTDATYLYGRGDGSDTITDNYDGTDKIVFGPGIALSDVGVRRAAEFDLVLTINDPNNPAANDQITIKNHFSGTMNRMERLEFADGSALTSSEIDSIVTDITGTEGDDTLQGYETDETFHGLGGDDTIDAGGGNDTLYGGTGDDTLNAGVGDDVVYGGAGDDSISSGFGGADLIYGEDGDDSISVWYGGLGTISGGQGNDTVTTYFTDATYLYGRGDGSDKITDNYDGTDKIVFGPGIALSDVRVRRAAEFDLVLTINDPNNPAANDQITIKNHFSWTMNRMERLEFADGSVLISSEIDGIVTNITGTEGDDTLQGYEADETFHGLGGDDTVDAGGGNDTIYGGTGDDALNAGAGNDVVYAGAGNDSIGNGMGGADLIYGEDGDDTISVWFGSQGTISGGLGNDTVTTYFTDATYLYGRGDGSDTITDNYDGTDKIVFGPGIALSDVGVRRAAEFDLVLTINDPNEPAANDQITIKNHFSGTMNRMERLEFTDGGAIDTGTLFVGDANANTLSGSTDADFIFGDTGDDSLSGNAGTDYLYGGIGNDVLDGGDNADTMIGGLGDDSYIVDNSGDVVSENASEGVDIVNSSVTQTLAVNLEHLVLTGTSEIDGTGNTTANLVRGNTAANVLSGAGGFDALEGDAGNDTLIDTEGGNYYNGGAGTDTLTGSAAGDFLIGGTGNDTINTGNGFDVIAFNLGDGQDSINQSVGIDDTVSLGGMGLSYASLSFQKSTNDLILNVSDTDKLTFKDWYAGTANKNVLNLQVMAEAMAAFDASSADPLLNKKVQTFSFQGLVNAFDVALAANPGIASWALTNALLQQHLSGNDTNALGGDLAYYYGKNGTLAGVGFDKAQDVVTSAQFGGEAQTLRPFAGLQNGVMPLG